MRLDVPDKFRYFLATPFEVLGHVFILVAMAIMGKRNAAWVSINAMQDAGMVEILSEEEYKAKYGELQEWLKDEEDTDRR